jgi:gluconate 2-dehydrogenase gamma chain
VSLVPQALAQDHAQDHPRDVTTTAAADTPASDLAAATYRHGAFFNNDDAKTVAAFAERLMPGAPGKPGATDANVLNYIDISLSGAYSDQQDFYRRGVAQLDAHCAAAYGKPFRQLGATQQDECIGALTQDKAPEFVWPTARAFFATLRTHTMEGMFSDPVYGGNKDFAGWRLVGFPGAQPIFTSADLSSKEAFTREPITGLQVQLTSKRG